MMSRIERLAAARRRTGSRQPDAATRGRRYRLRGPCTSLALLGLVPARPAAGGGRQRGVLGRLRGVRLADQL